MEYQINEKLIQAVRPRQILYDKNYDNYKNNNVRRKIWKDIGDEIGIPSYDCQKRWKRLREKYTNFVKKAKSGNYNKRMPEILMSMDFLSNYISDFPDHLDTPTDMEDSKFGDNDSPLQNFFAECDPNSVKEEHLTYNEPSSTGIVPIHSDYATQQSVQRSIFSSSSNKKRKLLLRKPSNINTEEYDGIDYFCLSMAQDLKDMEPSEQRRVKFEISKILNNATYKN